MGRDSTFSREVMDYAVDMARRMSFEILALNSAPLNSDSFSLFSTSRNKLCDEFKAISMKNVAAFREAAEASGIPFTHVVKFDEPEQALADVQCEFGNIEFVISEAQQPAVSERATEIHRPKNDDPGRRKAETFRSFYTDPYRHLPSGDRHLRLSGFRPVRPSGRQR
jgi:hypothetical protein